MEGFDAASVFNDDFTYFYADRVGPPRTAVELALCDSLSELRRSERVLDLCCGEGRIADHLAAEGASVVGLDRSMPYLEQASARAARKQLDARYVVADARSIPFRSAFDLLVCWYTSFGYFDDATDRQLLSEMRRALRPGGRLLLDLDGKEHLLRSGLPTQVRERGDDVMVEQFRYESATSRVTAIRTVVREGTVRRSAYFVRVFAEEELCAWLHEAGFEDVQLFGEDGRAFRAGGRRMVARARRGAAPRGLGA